jgi:hypothetical protein
MGATVHKLGQKYQPMSECISSLMKTCRKLYLQVNFKEKPTLRVLCLYNSIVSAYHCLTGPPLKTTLGYVGDLPAKTHQEFLNL